MSKFIDRLFHFHKFRVYQELIGCVIYDCEYCTVLTYKGDGGLVPVGHGITTFPGKCRRNKL